MKRFVLMTAASLAVTAAFGANTADTTSALQVAAYNDDLEAVQTLVRAGADVKAVSRYGVTPLELACTNGNAQMVELFLKAGADPNTKAPGGETARRQERACRRGSESA